MDNQWHNPWPFPDRMFSRNTDPVTSKQAITQERAETIAMQVLKRLNETPNQTCDEIAESLPKIIYRSISPRLAQLQRKGFIERTGVKMSKYGKWMNSYSLTAEGKIKCSQN